MTKVFEDYFSELQADMVSITMEYIESKADYVYIYASCEINTYYFDCFYIVNKTIVTHKHLLNDLNLDHAFDVSGKRQDAALNIGIKNLRQIKRLCQEYKREMPTEMRLIYDVKKNSLNTQYSYDLHYSNDKVLLPEIIFNQWFEEVAKENGQRV